MSNYVNFNVKLAHILGLNTAIYLSQIMDINEKAIRKDKVDKNFFTIDRNYITSRTTIAEKEQKEIENNLIKIGILERSSADANTIMLNITALTSILMSPDESLLKDISNISRPKKTKSEKILEALKDNIITVNPELRQAYFDWIDAVYAKDGFMTVKAVITAQSILSTYTTNNMSVALKILEIAAIHGYRDVSWAINTYNKDYKVNYTFSQQKEVPQPTTNSVVRKRLSNEIF